MKKTILMMMLVLLIGGFASEASAFAWSDFRERLGIGQETKDKEAQGRDFGIEPSQGRHREGVEKAIQAVNENEQYKSIAEVMGYKRVCLKILDAEDEDYTLVRQGREITFEEGCKDGEFTAKIRVEAFEELVKGLQKNNPGILRKVHRMDAIDVPWTVQVNAYRKCLFSRVC